MAKTFIQLNGKDLSERDLHVIILLMHGLTQVQIGEFLVLTANTARTNVRDLHNKLSLHCVVEIVRFGVKGGLTIDGVLDGREFLSMEKIQEIKDKYGIKY